MQAIQTKYLGPTNFRGSRIKVTCAARSITVDWNHSLNSEENHINAAKDLIAKLNWKGNIATGQLKDGSYVHVFTS